MSGTPYLKQLFDFKKLKKLRKQSGKSVYRVSLDSGVSRHAIAAMEDGTVTNPAMSTVCGLAKAYGLGVEELLMAVRK